jgi:alpha-1,6-mannosyltransferase
MISSSGGEQATNGPIRLACFALAVAVISQIVLARSFGPLSGSARAQWHVALSLVVGLSAPTALLLYAGWATRSREFGPRAIVIIVLVGLLMRIPYLGVGPMLEDDHFRYMLDGAMTARGMNPYTHAPVSLLQGTAPAANLNVAAAGQGAIAQINFPELRTIYPGTAQILFALAHVIKPWSIDGLRVVIAFCEMGTAFLCWHLLGVLRVPRHLVALVWCNPLLAFSLTGQAHIDAAIGPFLLTAIIAVLRSSGVSAGVMLGAAIGVKLWPVMLAPVIVRSLADQQRAPIGFLLAMSLVALLACLPLAIASLAPQSGLVAYARGWSINNLPYEWLSYAGYLVIGDARLERYLRGIIALSCLTTGVMLAFRPIADARDLVLRMAILSACVFYLSPAQFPWYSAWFMALAVLLPHWPLLAASAALPSYFLFFPLAERGLGDLFRFGLSGLHLVPVLLISACIWMRHRRDRHT